MKPTPPYANVVRETQATRLVSGDSTSYYWFVLRRSGVLKSEPTAVLLLVAAGLDYPTKLNKQVPRTVDYYSRTFRFLEQHNFLSTPPLARQQRVKNRRYMEVRYDTVYNLVKDIIRQLIHIRRVEAESLLLTHLNEPDLFLKFNQLDQLSLHIDSNPILQDCIRRYLISYGQLIRQTRGLQPNRVLPLWSILTDFLFLISAEDALEKTRDRLLKEKKLTSDSPAITETMEFKSCLRYLVPEVRTKIALKRSLLPDQQKLLVS